MIAWALTLMAAALALPAASAEEQTCAPVYRLYRTWPAGPWPPGPIYPARFTWRRSMPAKGRGDGTTYNGSITRSPGACSEPTGRNSHLLVREGAVRWRNLSRSKFDDQTAVRQIG